LGLSLDTRASAPTIASARPFCLGTSKIAGSSSFSNAPQFLFVNQQGGGNAASSGDELSLRALAQNLSDDSFSSDAVAQLASAMQLNDTSALESILLNIRSNPASAIAKILSSSVDNIETVLRGSVPDGVITSIAGARNHTLEKLGQFITASDSPPSARVKRALNKLVSGKLTAVRWLELIDVQHDGFSIDDPLSAIGKQPNPDMALASIISRASLALQTSFPSIASEIAQFFIKLKQYLDRQRSRGASWSILSTYYVSLCRKIEVKSKAASTITFSLEWIDGLSEFTQLLEQNVIRDLIARQHGKEPGKKPRITPYTKGDEKEKKEQPKKLSADEFKKCCEEVNRDVNKKDGIPPCVFFFHSKLKCSNQHKKEHTEKLHHDTRLKKSAAGPSQS
jgi:hypothetical protein